MGSNGMTRYDDLTKLFDPWRTQWIAQYREHQFLPVRIAQGFQEFLGCPETFSEHSLDVTAPKKKVRYVSAAEAEWDGGSEQFTLRVNDPFDFNTEVRFHKDGFFYFGLRVLLEHGPTTYPKEAFWFLLRTGFNGWGFTVWVQRSKAQFELGAAPYETEALCQHLFDLLKTDLAKSPMIRDTQEPNKIGFT
jgi:hypothetical protein